MRIEIWHLGSDPTIEIDGRLYRGAQIKCVLVARAACLPLMVEDTLECPWAFEISGQDAQDISKDIEAGILRDITGGRDKDHSNAVRQEEETQEAERRAVSGRSE